MNVLIITSLYPTEEKANLPKTTKAVHELVKRWADNNRIICIKPYRHSVKNISRILYKDSIRNIMGGQQKYTLDSVDIYVMEYCLLPFQRHVGARKKKKNNS